MLRDNQSGRSALALMLLLLLGIVAGAIFLPERFVAPFGNALVVDDRPNPSDAIVVLLGAGTPDRVIRAHELYSAKVAPLIAFGSGFRNRGIELDGPPGLLWLTSSDRYRTALKSLGVPRQDLLVIDTGNAYDTATELSAIAEHGKSVGWERVTLVTSVAHTRRVDIIWKRVGKGIWHTTVAARPSEMLGWWQRGEMRRAVGYEWGALLKESYAQIEALFSRAAS